MRACVDDDGALRFLRKEKRTEEAPKKRTIH